jgi:hypothetical protein
MSWFRSKKTAQGPDETAIAEAAGEPVDSGTASAADASAPANNAADSGMAGAADGSALANDAAVSDPVADLEREVLELMGEAEKPAEKEDAVAGQGEASNTAPSGNEAPAEQPAAAEPLPRKSLFARMFGGGKRQEQHTAQSAAGGAGEEGPSAEGHAAANVEQVLAQEEAAPERALDAEDVSEGQRTKHDTQDARLLEPAFAENELDPLDLGGPEDAQASETRQPPGNDAEPNPEQREPQEKRGLFSRLFGKSKRPSASEDLVEAGEAGTEGEQQQAGQAVSQVEEDSAERALDEEDWKTMMSNEQLGVIEIIQTDTSATKVEDEARELSWEEYQERARQTQGKTLDQVFMDKFKVMRHRHHACCKCCGPCCVRLENCFMERQKAEVSVKNKYDYPYKNIFGKTQNSASRIFAMRIANSRWFESLWLLTNWVHMALLIVGQELDSYALPWFTPLVPVGLYFIEVRLYTGSPDLAFTLFGRNPRL